MARIPEFKNEQEEADFWDTHSVADYLDELTEVDPQTEFPPAAGVPIPLRLERETVAQLRTVARRQGVGYQTLIRHWLLERLAEQPTGEAATIREPQGAYHGETPCI
ncbi:MAG: BrnA antitoxin family protein [Chloroflexota bacterium]|nr:BrnA antitoxin family protein [Chloroflexota bacterium]